VDRRSEWFGGASDEALVDFPAFEIRPPDRIAAEVGPVDVGARLRRQQPDPSSTAASAGGRTVPKRETITFTTLYMRTSSDRSDAFL
jgi:hypothetical protein